jgi:uncharacterized protein (DUF2062 family)
MNAITDPVLGGMLTAAVLLGVAIVAWSCAYRGRTRYSAERRGQRDEQ